MEAYIQQNGAREPIGGGSQELLERVVALEETVQGLSAALAGKLGTEKVTQSTAVTEAGYAADARQLNPAVGGSLADRVENTTNRLLWKKLSLSEHSNVNGELMREVSYSADLSLAGEVCVSLIIKGSKPCGQFTFQLGLGTADKFIHFEEHNDYYWRGYLSVNKQENRITVYTYKNNSDLERYYLTVGSAWAR